MSAISHPSVRDKVKKGGITGCSTSGCGWKCCGFMQGNYIVLHPNEIDMALKNGVSLDHLDIFDTNYYGGARATCHAQDTSVCDNGYKPLDCSSYPLFPMIGKQELTNEWLIGEKCPLQISDLKQHLVDVNKTWEHAVKINPSILTWLTKVKLIGYSRMKENGIKS